MNYEVDCITDKIVIQNLNKLYECKEPFDVIFSNRKSKTINGTYKPNNKLITINVSNFMNDEGIINKSMLMYTAMHELAHHIQHTEYGQKSTRCHTKLFHAILDDLADKAEEAGIYKPLIDLNIEGLISEARTISRAIANLQRDLGKILHKLNDACLEKGVRFEDVIKRKTRISLESAKKSFKIAMLDLPEGISADIQEALASERDDEKRKAMAASAQAGRSVAQVKRAGSSSSSGQKSENEFDNLLREKERLEKTIQTLQSRLKSVMERINSDSGLQPPRAAGG